MSVKNSRKEAKENLKLGKIILSKPYLLKALIDGAIFVTYDNSDNLKEGDIVELIGTGSSFRFRKV